MKSGSLLFLFAVWLSAQASAAEFKDGRVTRVIKDVQLLPEQAASRPAAVNDEVRGGTAVRTGADSRSELTFSDLTIARLGSNTIFSLNEGRAPLISTPAPCSCACPRVLAGPRSKQRLSLPRSRARR